MSRQSLLLLFKGVTTAYSSGAVEMARNILSVISNSLPAGVSASISPTGNEKYPHIMVRTGDASYEGVDYVMHVYEGVED